MCCRAMALSRMKPSCEMAAPGFLTRVRMAEGSPVAMTALHRADDRAPAPRDHADVLNVTAGNDFHQIVVD